MMIETQGNVTNVLTDLNYTLKGEEVRATLRKEAYGKSASDVLQSFFFGQEETTKQDLAIVERDSSVFFSLRWVLRVGGNLQQSTSLKMRNK